MMGYYGYDYDGHIGVLGLWGSLMMIIFWLAVVLLIVWLIREILGKNSDIKSGDKAIQILKERYAKGEINKEEFEAKKKDLLL